MRNYIKKILFWSNLFFAGCLFLSYLANFINPAKFWQFAFLGLGFPVFLLINIGFIIFWLFRKNMLFMISLIVIVGSWESVSRFVQIKLFYDEPKIASGIKLMSFNVRTFNQYNWLEGFQVRDSILSYLKTEQADIIFFQDFYTNESKKIQSREYIKEKLPDLKYSHLNFTSHGKPRANFGVATYSKYPIVNKGCINFHQSVNSCIFSDIVVNNDTIRFYNVHFESIRLRKTTYSFTDSILFSLNTKQINEVKDISGRLKNAYIKRGKQVNLVYKHINESPYRVVVCGDFNDTPVSYTYQKVRGNLKDAFIESGEGIGNTYRGSFPSFRIDYIFHSKTLKSSDYQTNNVNLSDHSPVSCRLILN